MCLSAKLIATSLLSITLLAGCGSNPQPLAQPTLNQEIPVTSVTEDPHGNKISAQGVGACTKEVSYPHQSGTNSAEVIAKGRIYCTRDSDPIVGIATVYLMDGLGNVIDQKTKEFRTSPTTTTEIKFGTPGFVATARCFPGTYIGAIRVKYYNLSGSVISIGLPAQTPPQKVTCDAY